MNIKDVLLQLLAQQSYITNKELASELGRRVSWVYQYKYKNKSMLTKLGVHTTREGFTRVDDVFFRAKRTLLLREADGLNNTTGFMYIIFSPSFPEFIKVGRTNNLKTRLLQYNSSNPYSDYTYLLYTPLLFDMFEAEDFVLQQLGESMYGKEWYGLDRLKEAKELIIGTTKE